MKKLYTILMSFALVAAGSMPLWAACVMESAASADWQAACCCAGPRTADAAEGCCPTNAAADKQAHAATCTCQWSPMQAEGDEVLVATPPTGARGEALTDRAPDQVAGRLTSVSETERSLFIPWRRSGAFSTAPPTGSPPVFILNCSILR